MKSILEINGDLREEITDVANVAGYLWQRGWSERNGGNITVNVSDYFKDETEELPAISKPEKIGLQVPYLKGCYFYCKGAGKYMRDLANNPMGNGSIIRICDDCESYEIIADKTVRPTSEISSHLAVHDYLISSGTNYKAIVHTHPVELVAMSHSNRFLDSRELTKTLLKMIPEAVVYAPFGLGIAPYGAPSSINLVNATLNQIKEGYDSVLWEKHGIFTVAENVMEAFDQIDVLNKSASIYINAKNMGFEPNGLSDEEMEEIRDLYKVKKQRYTNK